MMDRRDKNSFSLLLKRPLLLLKVLRANAASVPNLIPAPFIYITYFFSLPYSAKTSPLSLCFSCYCDSSWYQHIFCVICIIPSIGSWDSTNDKIRVWRFVRLTTESACVRFFLVMPPTRPAESQCKRHRKSTIHMRVFPPAPAYSMQQHTTNFIFSTACT